MLSPAHNNNNDLSDNVMVNKNVLQVENLNKQVNVLTNAPINRRINDESSSNQLRLQVAGVYLCRPSSNDSLNTIVSYLMNFIVMGSQTREAQFSRKAIESLVKKLKDKRDELDEFIRAVASSGSVKTKCVTIPRTLDGRLQVAGRKGFPHVVYSRTFRFLDLNKNELRSLENCTNGFDLKSDQVCVNPYHYERVVSSNDLSNYYFNVYDKKGAVCSRGFGKLSTRTKNCVLKNQKTVNTQQQNNKKISLQLPMVQKSLKPIQPLSINHLQSKKHNDSSTEMRQKFQMLKNFEYTSKVQNDCHNAYLQSQNNKNVPDLSMSMLNQIESNNVVSKLESSNSYDSTKSTKYVQQNVMLNLANKPEIILPQSQQNIFDTKILPQHYDHNLMQMSNLNNENFLYSNQNSTVLPQLSSLTSFSNMSNQYNIISKLNVANSSNSIPALNNLSINMPVNAENVLDDIEPFKPDFEKNKIHYLTNGTNVNSFPFKKFQTNSSLIPRYITGVSELHKVEMRPLISKKPLPKIWCTITYYEYDKIVGETFQARCTTLNVFIDGGFDSSNVNRFCLGTTMNLDRTDECENCRRYIGRGIMLTLKEEGDVWLTVLSHYSVFVQSRLLDIQAQKANVGSLPFFQDNLDPHEVYQYTTVKIFDLHLCYKELCELNTKRILAQKLMEMNIEEREREVSTRGIAMKDVDASVNLGVDDMKKLCLVKISFIKGFGGDFNHKLIKEVPCWISICVTRALQLLDQVMNF